MLVTLVVALWNPMMLQRKNILDDVYNSDKLFTNNDMKRFFRIYLKHLGGGERHEQDRIN